MTTLNNHKESLENWWQSLTDEWQGVFIFNYIVKTNFKSLFSRMTQAIVGDNLFNGKVYVCECHPELLICGHEYEIPAIIHSTLEETKLFDWTKTYYLHGEAENKNTCKLNISFDIKDFSGLKELNDLEEVYIFDSNIDIKELIPLASLSTININCKSVDKIPDILNLQIKSLRDINVYKSAHGVPGAHDMECEKKIELLRKLTKVRLNIVPNNLNDINNNEINMDSKSFIDNFCGIDDTDYYAALVNK